MPFDRAAYMRDYRVAVRAGEPTNIRGGPSRKAAPLADPPEASGVETPKAETLEPGAIPWVPLVALGLFVVVIIAVFYSSRSNGQEEDAERENSHV